MQLTQISLFLAALSALAAAAPTKRAQAYSVEPNFEADFTSLEERSQQAYGKNPNFEAAFASPEKRSQQAYGKETNFESGLGKDEKN
ncbi:hypothetical protein M409DRAFT_23332 [Zasmidium cellare ATCC 36951]|uniref:Uncharacterized protein n=1 Tax=Zasmidium cellare ATCC 36951 TaxID=1080233 RepID=A0A6A6CJK7_ZASCE|nr:uncharacterized protein M409DRAFT_23332 [Zasmidium cellare ATCC 36951]KAF2166142.1 hypothetical protein M409DRAFT_23332 [Zasmidium cellare ATCC 36951]